MSLVVFLLVLACIGLSAIALLFLFLRLLRRRAVWSQANAASAIARPLIDAAVLDYAAGNPDQKRLRRFVVEDRLELETCLLRYHAHLSGEGRARLSDLALDLALVHQWCDDATSRSVERRRAALSRLSLVAGHEPSRRLSGDLLLKALKDPDREARLEAARSLVHSGELPAIEAVFRVAVTHSLIIRAILAEDLRPHALTLCAHAIPRALNSTEPREVAATLELIAAWERALPLTCIAPLIDHRDPAVRRLAVKVLPLASAADDLRDGLLCALRDPEDDIAAMAAQAAGKLKLQAALVPLAAALRSGRVVLSRAAAAALAQLPPRGWATLEELSRYGNPITASAALEALERARKASQGVKA